MTENEKKETATEMSAQARKAQQIIADAEKNGYLPKINVDDYDKWLIEERQITLEKRIAEKKEIRDKQYLEDREKLGKRYPEPLDFNFGNWNKKNCDNYAIRVACTDSTLPREEQLENKKKLAQMTEEMAYLNASQIRKPDDWKINSENMVIETEKEVRAYNQELIKKQMMARSGQTYEIPSSLKKPNTNFDTPLVVSGQKGEIFVNKEIIQGMKDTGYKMLDEAAEGNPAAMNCLIYHELNHKHNYDFDGLGQLSYTPVNAIKGDVLTEKISLCTEYMHMVKEYNDRKANGDTTIKYDNGTEKPLNHLFEACPGLSEAVQKYGTDIDNPKTKREIIAAAMNYWEQDRGHAYTGQTKRMMMTGNYAFNQLSFSQQLDKLKNEEDTYKKVSEAMLSGINIGDKQIDLTDCKDLVDTYTTDKAKEMIEAHNKKDEFYDEHISLPTYQEYQEINQHLEAIGKKTDAEKMEHIAKTVQTASTSTKSYDKSLEDIMLKHNPQITSGFLDIERTDKTVVATFGGKKYDITEYAKPKKELAQKPMMQTNNLLESGR